MKPDTVPHLFEGYGVELEYMVVRRDTLDIFPIVDEILRAVAGSYVNEVEMGLIGWSNELVLHVAEIKNVEPVSELDGLSGIYQEQVDRINKILEPHNGCLMPTAMHPWMEPLKETRLWPHSNSIIYDSYNRIFNCQGHGWANVQSTHVNLGFSGDEEFARLHAALRLILPLLPALAASSPVVDGQLSGLYDTRLDYYRNNQRRVPVIAGHLIPERVYSRKDYEEQILQRIYHDIAPHDPEGILQFEWLNSRGAIARFDRSAIEIRLLDIQECPRADFAVACGIIAVLKGLAAQKWSDFSRQSGFAEADLSVILLSTIKQGEQAVIDSQDYLDIFGFKGHSATTGELWLYLIEQTEEYWSLKQRESLDDLQTLLEHGTLSARIMKALGNDLSREHLKDVYNRLCRCLAHGELFLG